jgi:hypothetical protein
MVYLPPISLHIKLRSPICKTITAFIITAMVISSPIFMLFNPAQEAFAVRSADSIDGSSDYHSSPLTQEMTSSSTSTPATMAPSTLSQDGDFSTQAALSLTRASQTNNFVASKAYYDISFRTATAGIIKSIVIDFPAGTAVGSALLVEATGIGPGTVSASAGEVLTYTVTNAVNVPANTIIRIQISNINNPPTPSASFTVSITTRNAANGIIDGPTATSAYNMVQVGNAQIAPGAVTTTKIATGAVSSTDIAQSFMKKVTVLDDAAGNAVGWNPDGSTIDFDISEPAVDNVQTTYVNLYVYGGGIPNTPDCRPVSLNPGHLDIRCDIPPQPGDELQYVVENLPPHIVS